MGADGAIALASRFLACLADVTSNVLGVPSRQGIAEAREMRTTGKKESPAGRSASSCCFSDGPNSGEAAAGTKNVVRKRLQK